MKKLCVSFPLLLLLLALSTSVLAQLPSSGLRLHLKADAGTSTTTSGQTLATWADQSGNGYQAFQDNPAQRPSYIVENGISMIRFNPTSPTSMDLPKPSEMGFSSSDYEIFIAAKSSSSAVQFLIAGGVNYHEIQIYNNGGRYTARSGIFIDNPNGVNNGSFHVVNAIGTTTEATLGFDGVYSTVATDATTSVDSKIILGSRATGEYRLDGDIAEVIIYNRKLTSQESMQVTEYLRDKYSTPFTAYAAPGTPASNLNFSSVTQNSMNLNLTKGGGTHRLILARKGSAVNAAPVSGVSYTGNLAFGLGNQIGSGNYVMYAGTAGTTNPMTNMEFDETYHFAVYEYYLINGVPQYSAASTASQATLNLTQTSNLQITERTANSFSGSLTPGSGGSRLIVARQGGAVNWGPTDGVEYTGNTNFGSGSQIGTGNYVIHSGNNGTGYSMTNLEASTVYYLAVFEFTYYDGSPKYLDSNPATASDITFPGTPASNIQFSSVGLNEMTVSFTPGNGNKRIVVAREGSAVSAGPTNGQTYSASSVFESGQDLGSGNYVIYNGTGNSVTLTGLSNTTTYHFAVYEYSGYDGLTSYLTTSPAVGSNSTTVVPFPTITEATFGTGTSTSRQITGLVNPNGYETTIEVIYGTDAGNLNSTTASHSIGSGIVNVADTVDVTGLTTGQTYYAKIRATNIRGAIESNTVTLVPLNLSSLVGWYRADIAEVDGANKVSTWYDYSGNDNDMSNSTYSRTPSYTPTGINGKPALIFNSTSLSFDASEMGIFSSDKDFFIVYKSSVNTTQIMMSDQGSSLIRLNEGGYGIDIQFHDISYGSSGDYTDGNGQVIHYKEDFALGSNTQTKLRMNDEEFISTNGAYFFLYGGTTTVGRDNSYQTFNGQIAEIMFFNQLLPFEQRKEIAQYLSDRYAISMFIPSVPETTASSLNFTNIGATNFDVGFIKGDGERRIIVARLSGSVKTAPTSNTVYSANANFGSGSNLGNNNYVVYDGTGNSVAITGLSANSEYTIDVYEYNNMELDPQYMLSSPNSATQATQNVSPPTVQLSTISTLGNNTVTIPSLINPNGFQTTFQVSYSTNSESLSSSTSVQAVGSQSTAQAMSTSLTGLTAGTKYYYKVTATNIGGTTESSIDSLFTGYYVNQAGVSLPSLQFWVAGDGATYTANSGDPVSNWANQTAEVTSAYQNLSEYRPSRITDSGVSFLRFDGNAGVKFLEMGIADSLGILNSDYEIFMVARSSSSNIGFLMGGTVGNFEIHTRPDGGVGTRFIPKSGLYVDSPVNSTDGNFHIFNAKATSTQAMLRIDGNSTINNQDAHSSVASQLLMGARRDGSSAYNFDGDIAEILIYNAGLSDSENLLISQYLANKYSITLTPFITPTEQASSVVFSNYVAEGITVSATAGNGTNRLFVMRENGTAAVAPTNGIVYTANSIYGSGSTTGTGNYVISASSATSVDVTGLTAETVYTVDVYEFNPAGSDPRYITSSPASGDIDILNFDDHEGKIAYLVTNVSDNDTGTGRNGTLRYVMNAINSHASDSTSLIDLRLLEGTITLTSALPPINYNTIVLGPGKEDLTVSGNDLYRPFFVGAGTAPFTAEEPASPNVTLKDFTIANGLGKGGNGNSAGGGAAGMGGALFINDGAVTLEGLNFSENKAQGGNAGASNGSGGGGGFAGNGNSSTAGTSGYLGGEVPTSPGGNGGPGAGGLGDAYVAGDGGFGAGGAGALYVNTYGATTIGGDGGFGGGGGGHGFINAAAVSGIQGMGGFGGGNGISYDTYYTRGGGGAGMGGAVFNRFGNVVIRNSSFTANSVTGGVGGNETTPSNGSEYGGAIFNYQGVILSSNVSFGTGEDANSATNEADFYDYNESNLNSSVISLLDASDTNNSSFTVNAEITTFGVSGSYYIAHGSNNSNLSETTATVNFTGETAEKTLAVPLNGLDLSAEYYYKVVVTNEFGTYESSIERVISEPTIISSLPIISEISTTSISGSVSKGNGRKRIILAKKGSAVDAQPVDGQIYTSSSVFGSGTEIGSGNFVVYNAIDSTFSITGLDTGEEYHFSVFEYNGTDETEYLTSSVLKFSENTISSIPEKLAGSALKFGGADEEVVIPINSVINTSSTLSLEAWINPTENTAFAQIIGNIHDTGITESGYGLTMDGNGGLFFAVKTQSGIIEYLSSGGGINLNEWQHVAGTYDGNTKRIYINGVEVASSTNGTGTINYTPVNNLRIGRYSDDDESYSYAGKIDEVRIWNTARTQEQINEYMSKPIQSNYQDMIAYWQLNEATGITVVDKISGLNGTLQNFEFDANNGWIASSTTFVDESSVQVTLTGTEGWRLLSVPVVDSTIAPLLRNIWTQGFTGAKATSGSSNVYTWSTATSGNFNWTALTDIANSPGVGSGSLVYVYSDDNYTEPGNAGFPKTFQIEGFEPVGDQTLTSLLNTHVNGYALLGNPFKKDVDWDDFTKSNLSNSVYVYDNNSAGWKAWNGTLGSLTDGVIGAFNGFFVQTTGANPSIVIPASAKQDSVKSFLGKQVEQADPFYFSLEVTSDSGLANKAWFQFSEDGNFGVDASDAFQFAPLSEHYVSLASVLDDTTKLDINSLPFITEFFEVPLELNTTEVGTHSFAIEDVNFPEDWEIELFDSETETSSNLKEAYVFTVNASKAKRELEGVQSTTTPLENTSLPSIASIVSQNKSKVASSTRFILKIKPSQPVSSEITPNIPQEIELEQNYPNPFNPSTTIAFGVPATSKVRLEVFDLLGRKVATLINDESMTAGRYNIQFDARHLASGVYIYRFQSGNTIITKKLTLIK
tara:strand:- start:3532 stop:11919 length:8388 start_codon:yes stop_codon:yes gene_type:complete